MAVYKVPQDVEAEDKLLGPLTIKQFIYAIIVFISGWLTIVVAQNPITLIFLPLTLAPALFFGFLIFLGIKNSSQPAESYLAALVRFYFKPHQRIWNQEGVMQNVHITAPKRDRHQYSDNLSKVEVTSRLKNLANVMDSRGWASKDPRFQPNVVLPTSETGDRLLDINQLPAMTQQSDDSTQHDVMDETASPLAAQFDEMIQKTEKQHRQDAVKHMNDPDYNPYPAMKQHVISPSGTKNKQPEIKDVKSQTGEAEKKEDDQKQTPTPQTQTTDEKQQTQNSAKAPDPTITRLVDNSSGLSVQTLAGEAKRLKSLESGDEVSLH